MLSLRGKTGTERNTAKGRQMKKMRKGTTDGKEKRTRPTQQAAVTHCLLFRS